MLKIYNVFNKGESFLYLSAWKNGKKDTQVSKNIKEAIQVTETTYRSI